MQADMSLIPGLAMLLVGALLLWRGARGQRIDDHPICRACGFDLFGLPPESHRCSECGVDLRKRRTIRIGHRQPARVVMVLGMLLLFAGGGWLGTVYKPVFRQLDVNQYKPVWWLLIDAKSSTVQTRDVALKELLNRLKSKALNKSQVQRIAQRAIEVQGDKTKPWTTAWGDFVESAQLAGVLPSEQWQQYIKQALIAFQLDVRPKVRRGALLPLRLTPGPARVGTVVDIGATYQLGPIHVNGILCDQSHWGGFKGTVGIGGSGGGGFWSWLLPLDNSVLTKVQDGALTVRVTLDVGMFWAPAPLISPRTPAYQTRLDLDATWELVGGATVKLVNDESLRPAVEKSLQVKAFHSKFASSDPDHVCVDVSCNSPPVGLAFEVLVRQGDKEWNMERRLGQVFRVGANGSWDSRGRLLGVQGNVVDVILRPSVPAAESEINCMEIWNGEIVFPGVQVEGLNPPATQPAR